jgi:hypothetical protein
VRHPDRLDTYFVDTTLAFAAMGATAHGTVDSIGGGVKRRDVLLRP